MASSGWRRQAHDCHDQKTMMLVASVSSLVPVVLNVDEDLLLLSYGLHAAVATAVSVASSSLVAVLAPRPWIVTHLRSKLALCSDCGGHPLPLLLELS